MPRRRIREWRYSFTIPDLGSIWRRVSGSTPPATLLPTEPTVNPLGRGLGGLKSKSGESAVNKYLLPLPGIERRPCRPCRAELSRLLGGLYKARKNWNLYWGHVFRLSLSLSLSLLPSFGSSAVRQVFNPTLETSRSLIAQPVWRRGTGWTTWVRFPKGQGIFLYSTASRHALEPCNEYWGIFPLG
jgi:hypothetical protein